MFISIIINHKKKQVITGDRHQSEKPQEKREKSLVTDTNLKIQIQQYESGSSHSFENPAGLGIAIIFNDAYIDDWYAIKDLLLQYNATVTFFVSHFDSLSPLDIQHLKELNENCNEIGYHGYNHIHAVQCLNEGHTVAEYLSTEIFPGVNAMRNQDPFPASFAYPYGENNAGLCKPNWTGILYCIKT